MSRQSQCSRVFQAPSRTVGFTRLFHTLSSIQATNTSLAVVPQSPVVVHTSLHSRTLDQTVSINDCRPLGCGSTSQSHQNILASSLNVPETLAGERRSVTPTSLAAVGIHGIPLKGGGGGQDTASASFHEEGRARWVSDYGVGQLSRYQLQHPDQKGKKGENPEVETRLGRGDGPERTGGGGGFYLCSIGWWWPLYPGREPANKLVGRLAGAVLMGVTRREGPVPGSWHLVWWTGDPSGFQIDPRKPYGSIAPISTVRLPIVFCERSRTPPSSEPLLPLPTPQRLRAPRRTDGRIVYHKPAAARQYIIHNRGRHSRRQRYTSGRSNSRAPASCNVNETRRENAKRFCDVLTRGAEGERETEREGILLERRLPDKDELAQKTMVSRRKEKNGSGNITTEHLASTAGVRLGKPGCYEKRKISGSILALRNLLRRHEIRAGEPLRQTEHRPQERFANKYHGRLLFTQFKAGEESTSRSCHSKQTTVQEESVDGVPAAIAALVISRDLQDSPYYLRKSPINERSTTVCPNHVQFTQKGRDVTARQQPMKKRHLLEYINISVCCGVPHDQLIGISTFPECLTGVVYLQFSQEELPLLLEDIPLTVRNGMIFEHDDAPSHLHRAVRGSPLVDDRPIMNAVKYRVVSGVVWSNRTMVSPNTDANRPGVLAAVDIDDSLIICLKCQKLKDVSKVEIFPIRGAAMAERLDCPHPTKANRAQSPAWSLTDFSQTGIVPDEGEFSRGSPRFS
ncbi:hypothetical protein PR048_024701 [Dryococelus australis]|uniref:Uncharacterized protein n=1 Tax=Dryococelus australis TaxID=614101 RepID=A0ABQ9GPA8_9NEOP|nr:hypothetical protein PR048_024701 [Dryococelus australis]